MTIRCLKLVEMTETAILNNPDWRRKIVGALLLFLRIRNSKVYCEDLDCLIKSAMEMQKIPQMEAGSEILLAEAEIAEVFPSLTNPEAEEVDDYFVSLLTRFGDSLASRLLKELGGKLGSFWNEEIFAGTSAERLLMSFNTHKLGNENIQEDFQLTQIFPEVNRKKVIDIIRDYYEKRGFETTREISSLGIMFRQKGKDVIVALTDMPDQIFVTVNVLKF